MSTDVAVLGFKVPARLRDRGLDATTKALAGGGGGAGRRISIKGSVFRMIVDGKQVAENEDRSMNIVVVAAAPSINRQYYEGEYDENKISGPTCFSADGKTPGKESEKMQSTSCDTCPQNIAGSGKGDSRACRYQHRLAVVLEGEIGGPVYQLAVPATSLFGKGEPNNVKMPLQAYARHLAENGVPIADVVTEMKFDTKSSTPKLTFRAIRALDDEEAAIAESQGNSTDAQGAISLTVFKTDTKNRAVEEEVVEESVVEEEVAAKPAKAKAVAAAAPEEVEDAEPVVAAKPKTPAPTAKRPVAAVISKWDD